ncbi:MAG: hypothetical protein AAGE52_13110 [Myxococcota bacterium]
MELHVHRLLAGSFLATLVHEVLDEIMDGLGHIRTNPSTDRFGRGREVFAVYREGARAWVEIPDFVLRAIATRGSRIYEVEAKNLIDDDHPDGGTHEFVSQVRGYDTRREELVVVADGVEFADDGLFRGGSLETSAAELLFELLQEYAGLTQKLHELPVEYLVYENRLRLEAEAKFPEGRLRAAWRAIQEAEDWTVEERDGQVRLRLALGEGARRILILRPEEWAELKDALS